ncbi:hypothetical protein MSAN_02092500 [Mycena sanguinolenta]|uniref:Uncharacterized protein n=1 Tax=Mycena sanguinolenta TaxID=230812 RepID=A0A8H7CKH6_9AGAR|nr:hypothetical protein MSAN_02092500 [Mycena sanguinolenta]
MLIDPLRTLKIGLPSSADCPLLGIRLPTPRSRKLRPLSFGAASFHGLRPAMEELEHPKAYLLPFVRTRGADDVLVLALLNVLVDAGVFTSTVTVKALPRSRFARSIDNPEAIQAPSTTRAPPAPKSRRMIFRSGHLGIYQERA